MATNTMFWRLPVLIVGLTWLSSLPRHADAQGDVTTAAPVVTTATAGPPTAACQWTQINDRHVFGATEYPAAADVEACKTKCKGTSGCTGIDWNEGASTKCYLATNEVLYDLIGNKHYVYNSTAVCPGSCQPSWTSFANTNQFGCVSNKTITNEPDCKAACVASPTCIAIDWDPGNTAGEKCWLCFPTSQQWNNGTAPGVTHWTVNKNTNCGPGGTVGIQTAITPAGTGVPGTCTPEWIVYPNTNVGGGTATPSATSVDACKKACTDLSTCTGIDWDSNAGANPNCWLSGAGGTWFNGTATGVTHYQIVRKTNCASCATIWTPYPNTNVGGGTPNAAYTTVEACQTACLAVASCTGVDWDSVNPTTKCWFTGNGQWFNGTAQGVTHYTFSKSTNCGTCAPIWTPYPNTNVGGGTPNTVPTTPEACQAACIAVTTCTGIDWDSVNPTTKCWLTGNGQWFNGTASGVTHYTVDRNSNCVGGTGLAGGSVTPPGGTGVPACSPIWTPYPNTNVGGGTYNPGTTEADCRAACLALPTCTGYDWDPNNPSGKKCWLSGNGQWFNGTAAGVTHYYLNRNTDCKGACSPVWTPYENTLVKGGTPNPAATEDACKADCIARPPCPGIDWDPNNPDGNKCWLSGTGGLWVNGTATGVRHSVLDNNCASAPPTCGPIWVQYNNTLVKGGTATPAVSTDICKTACVNSQPCTGIDWDPNNPDGNTCWLSGTGTWVNGTAIGVTHYYLIRTPSTCQGQTRSTTPAFP